MSRNLLVYRTILVLWCIAGITPMCFALEYATILNNPPSTHPNPNQLPVAYAGEDITACVSEEITFDGSKSFIPNKESVFSQWDLHDRWPTGERALEQGLKFRYTYQKPGVYRVKFTVESANQFRPHISSDTLKVTVNSPPKVSFKIPVQTFLVGQKINFSASGSRDPDGDRLEFYWNFGDGTEIKAGSKASHIYKSGGNYTVTVSVDDGKGSICSRVSTNAAIKVNSAPVANAGEDEEACVGQTIEFNGSKSMDREGDPLVYSWSLGNGTVKNGMNLSYQYSKEGIYQAILTVRKEKIPQVPASLDTRLITINTPPVAVMETTPETNKGQEHSFNGSASYDPDGDRLEYFWEFGDGTSLQGESRPSHAFQEEGTYKVTMIVGDRRKTSCSTAIATKVVTVKTAAETPKTSD